MESRELYKQKYEAQMHEWGAKIDVMTARIEKMTAQAKLDAKPRLDAVQGKFAAAKAKLAEVAAATDETWGSMTQQVDHAWTDFSAAAQGAYDAMKAHGKD